MLWRQSLFFILRTTILGLAFSFVIITIWPSLVRDRDQAIEPHQIQSGSRSSGPVSYAAAVDKAAPAVVNINTAKVVTVRRRHSFFDDPIFRRFFGRDLDNFIGRPQQQLQTSLGSGVIISDKGYILTNNHVIKGADTIQVSLRDGRMTKAKLVGADPETDLAVLKIKLDKLPSITLGQSEKLRIGDVVLAIGNPFGVGQTVTLGIVSATGRNKLGINTFENFIQTDAAINPGNSGGALIDAHGNLVGINTAIFSRSGGSQGIGFAIPVSLSQEVLQDIIKHGRPVRGWLGIEGDPVTEEIARTLELDKAQGIVVIGVLRNGPAHKAGVEPGDVIISIDGKPVTGTHETLLAISRHRPGSKIKLGVIRDSKQKQIIATVIERPRERPKKQPAK
ncbi:MAG: Do family serine endopeptidase [Proteobacteria bacterium]|nr:Do family serine endopeptidase [Pseudomonadota bacterium]